MASFGEIVSTVGAAVGVATTILSGAGQASSDPGIRQSSIKAQADLQSEGYELASRNMESGSNSEYGQSNYGNNSYDD